MAAAGLPEPNKDHALIVAKFARDCLQRMDTLTRKLEVTLGPDTADLELRVGIHTGQVTVRNMSMSVDMLCNTQKQKPL